MKNRIEQIMKDQKLPPTAFAKQIDINPSALSHILNGRNQPSLDMVRKIMQHYPDVAPDWLINGTGTMMRANEPIAKPASFLDNKNFLNEDTETVEKQAVKTELITQTEPYTELLPKQTEVQNTTILPSEQPSKQLARLIAVFSDGSIEEYMQKSEI